MLEQIFINSVNGILMGGVFKLFTTEGFRAVAVEDESERNLFF